MYRGYIKLWRAIEENPISKRPAYLSVWLFILRNVNHKECSIIWNNTKTMIKRGQFITSADKIAQGTGVPRGTVERILKYLENEVMIEEQTTRKFRLITAINYDKYQSSEEQNEEQVRNKRGTSEEQVDTNNNDNNIKNEKNVETSELSSQVKEIMDIFYKINPSLNWGNKTTRMACEWLIKKYTLLGAKAMAESVVAVQGRPYAPVATTPYQMKEKLAQFEIYFKQQKTNKNNLIKV